MKTNREYKDSMIRSLLNHPKKALKLYCDIKGIEYNEETPVEMKQIEAQFYSKLRSDILFEIDGKMVVFIEHQSTLNKNMPLRILQYFMTYISVYYRLGAARYAEKQIKIPTPEFYVLYNGKTTHPPEMRLSDAFAQEAAPPSMELTVKVININKESLPPALQKNEEINGYATFVAKVEKHEKTETRKAAIQKAIKECIEEGILTEYLQKHRNEVESMFSLVYDEEMARQVAREEGIEKGAEISLRFAIKSSVPISVLEGMADVAGIPRSRLAELIAQEEAAQKSA